VKQALGYQALKTYLEGDLSREAAVEQGKQHSRNYAKRQMTWLRGQMAAPLIMQFLHGWDEIKEQQLT
jgi:tRNA A37 N6-isopentenylltransferase MiaA